METRELIFGEEIQDNSKVLVCTYKNKIFDFGESVDRYKPTYIQTD